MGKGMGKGMGIRVGGQGLIQCLMEQGAVVGVLEDKGNDPPS